MDVPDYWADPFFEEHKVHVRFDSEYAHPDHKYRVVMCRVPRWESRRFVECMKSLKNVMALSGMIDYEEVCRTLFSRMKNA